MKKRCPNCKATLTIKELLSISPTHPSWCKKCDNFYKNTWGAELISLILFLLSLYLIYSLQDINTIFELLTYLLAGLFLYSFFHIYFASPIIYEIVEKHCEICGRLDVGYYAPFDKICSECVDKKKNAPNKKINEDAQ